MTRVSSQSGLPYPGQDESSNPLRSVMAAIRRIMRRSMRRVMLGFLAFVAINFVLLVVNRSGSTGLDVSSLGLVRSSISPETPEEPEVPKYLWSYIPGVEETSEERVTEDVWKWLNKQRRKGYKRPSWGALSQQGPKASIVTNLKQDTRYLTLFQGGDGWNNQVIAACNNVLLAIKSGRTPILSPFLPAGGHLGGDTQWLSVFEVFDFTGVVKHHHLPVIDMLELKTPAKPWWFANELIAKRHQSVIYDGELKQKRPLRKIAAETSEDQVVMEDTFADEWLSVGDEIEAEEPEEDTIKCWSTTMSASSDDGGVHVYPLAPIQIEWTPLPRSAFHTYAHNIAWASTNGTAAAIAGYTNPGDELPTEVVERLEELGRPPSTMRTDEKINCLDRAFFLHTMADSEIRKEWREGVGAWDAVGKYMKFQPGITRMADDLVRKLLGARWDEPVPLYLAVHIRRTDLEGEYRDMTQRQWSHMAWELLHEMKRDGVHVQHILFTTDEKDPAWTDELKRLGWVMVEHGVYKTGARLDWWLPTILDSAILSSAQIFLGRSDSTMSILPYRRVLDWGSGMARFVEPRELDVPEDWEWREDW